MATLVDARGLSCPQPVILSRNAIKQGGFPIVVLVDTATSRDNVRRSAERMGCAVTVETAGDEYRLTLTN